jgi:hypothetical protein
MNKLYEALEVCLNEVEQGADVDTVLFRYPELADELRPILEASVKAMEMAAPAPSDEVIKRNRAKLIQHASEMRDRKAAPISRRVWSVPLRRTLVMLLVLALLFVSGTNLVRAASTTLPGDSLYPVKRTWEDVLLLFTFDMNKREELEFEHENERLEELHELFAEGRYAEVDFAGYVTRQSGTEWRVSGITVLISSQTRLPDEQVVIGAAVRVRGQIQSNMSVMAERIQLLPPNSKLPEVEDDDPEVEENEDEEEGSELEDESNHGPGNEAPSIPIAPTFAPEFEPEDVSLDGVVSSIKNNLIVVNGIAMDIQFAEIKGTSLAGATVKVEGYYDASGVFIVTKIEFRDSGSDSGSDSNNNSGEDNENSNDDNDSDNEPDDD